MGVSYLSRDSTRAFFPLILSIVKLIYHILMCIDLTNYLDAKISNLIVSVMSIDSCCVQRRKQRETRDRTREKN